MCKNDHCVFCFVMIYLKMILCKSHETEFKNIVYIWDAFFCVFKWATNDMCCTLNEHKHTNGDVHFKCIFYDKTVIIALDLCKPTR